MVDVVGINDMSFFDLLWRRKCCGGSPRPLASLWKIKRSCKKFAGTQPLLPLPQQPQALRPPPLTSLRCSYTWTVPKVRLLGHTASGCPPHPSNPNSMEVEVKLRLPHSSAHQRVYSLLSPFHRNIHVHDNFFFDGAAGELSSHGAVLRLRFYDGDSHCAVALKVGAVIAEGISRVAEDEEPFDPVVGRLCVNDPAVILTADSRVLRRAKEEFGVGDGGFVCLGGFKNVRNVFDWNGLVLELDATEYSFGTCFEIECESSDPERAKKLLEELLQKNGISYSYSQVSKFGVFRSGRMPLL